MSVAGTTGTTATQTTSSLSSLTNKLGKDDFIKLLLTEMQYQDVYNTMDNKETITQLAQFSSLEQTQNMTTSLEKLATQMSQSNFLSGLNLLGREVGYILNDQQYSGTVDALKQVDGEYVAVVGENEVPLEDINLVV